jgi:hypothetical protein
MVQVKITNAEDSKKYNLSKEDLTKIGKGALIAGTGALLTFALEAVPNIDFGSNTAIVVAGISIVINFLLKMLKGKQE